jgi:hypothetical protein
MESNSKPRANRAIAKYRQITIHAVRACATFSAASAFHFAGYPIFANNLAKHILRKEYHLVDQYRFIMDMFNKNEYIDDGLRKQLYFTKIKKPKQWNPLADSKKSVISIITVQSDDGKQDHALAIVGDVIFDANLKYGLELNKDGLNEACSSDTRNCKFSYVLCGLLFNKIIKK